MRTIDIDEAKAHPFEPAEQAPRDESFLIASSVPDRLGRLGFLETGFEVPEDFDRMGDAEIKRLIGE